MTYWTMGEADGIPSVTLCEGHALVATNLPCALFGLGPYETMAEAALELETITSVFGDGKVSFDFTESEDGECGACRNGEPFHTDDIILEVTEGGDAA